MKGKVWKGWLYLCADGEPIGIHFHGDGDGSSRVYFRRPSDIGGTPYAKVEIRVTQSPRLYKPRPFRRWGAGSKQAAKSGGR